ncbi:MAG: transporter substrate-binding domain-containing protein [Halopseudomonas sp.]
MIPIQKRAVETLSIRKITSILLITLGLWGSGVAAADNPVANKTVRIATMHNYPPFVYAQSNAAFIRDEVIAPGSDSAVIRGYAWDVLRESFHAVGYRIELTVAPWARAVMYMENQTADVLFPTSKNHLRLQKYAYANNALTKNNLLIYVRADTDLQWRGFVTLSGKAVAVIRGFNYGEA